jgi:hypothetical protein
MGSSITTWENVGAYFTFADNPFALVLFAIGTAAIIDGLFQLSVMKMRHLEKLSSVYSCFQQG